MTETARKVCLALAKRHLKRAQEHPRPADPRTIVGALTCTGSVGREVAELFAEMNRLTNHDEVRFWAGMVIRYGG